MWQAATLDPAVVIRAPCEGAMMVTNIVGASMRFELLDHMLLCLAASQNTSVEVQVVGIVFLFIRSGEEVHPWFIIDVG